MALSGYITPSFPFIYSVIIHLVLLIHRCYQYRLCICFATKHQDNWVTDSLGAHVLLVDVDTYLLTTLLIIYLQLLRDKTAVWSDLVQESRTP